MKEHRLRTAKPIDGKEEPHVFIEFKEDGWLEVTNDSTLTHKAIHVFLDAIEAERIKPIMCAERAFRIGIVKEWKESGVIS